MSEVSKGPVEAGGTADYVQELNIPPLPPSNLNNCRIIDLEYNLKVEACAESWLVSPPLYLFLALFELIFKSYTISFFGSRVSIGPYRYRPKRFGYVCLSRIEIALDYTRLEYICFATVSVSFVGITETCPAAPSSLWAPFRLPFTIPRAHRSTRRRVIQTSRRRPVSSYPRRIMRCRRYRNLIYIPTYVRPLRARRSLVVFSFRSVRACRAIFERHLDILMRT